MPKNNNEQVNKATKKNKRRPLRHRGGGGLGCLLGLITTFLCVIAIALTVGYFILDRFLATNYDMSANDCIHLVSSIWSVDESKVITEGEATEEDRENFYSTLGDTLFIKDELVSSLVDTAVDEYVIPMVSDMVSGGGYLSSAPKMENGNGQDLQSYLLALLEDGVIDQDKIKDYFENPLSAQEKYNDYFVMNIEGKGLVSTVDYVINRVLLSNPDTKALANTFGISQVKFTSNTQNGLPFKQINLVLDVKVQKAVIAFLESQMGYEMLGDNAKYVRQVAGILPQRLLLSVDFNLKGNTASIDFRINNLTNEDVSKWLNLATSLTGTDFKELIDDSVDTAYGEIRNSLIGYVDINNLIQNGSLNVDVFEILAKVLNEQLGLEGEDALTKIDATSTISNVLYANLDVSGKAIQDIVEEEAPYFVSSSWEKETEEDFIKWLQTNLAFKDKDGLKKAIADFTDETGKFVIPTEYTAFLEFIDTQYLKNGTAFLKEGLSFDDRYVAYAFQKGKKQIFETAGYAEFGDALALQYVSISQEKIDNITHTFLSLGMSAKTEELCNALGYSDFAFVSSLIGKEVFLCAKADITLDTSIQRETTQLRINGLSTNQTNDILSTVKKVMGYDLVDEFVNKNIDVFIEQILEKTSSSFTLGFSVKENEDGSTTGMLILPSVTDILEVVLKESQIDIDVEKTIDAIGAFLKSNPVMKGENYLQFLADTSMAITGKEDSFETYSQVVSSAFLSKYFLSEDSNLNDIIPILLKAIEQTDGALDDLLGTEEKDGLIKINSAYFNANPTVETTKPVVDGHTLAYIINESKDTISSLLGQEVALYLQYIDLKDIKIENGYLNVIVSSTPKQILSIDGLNLDKYITNFIYGIFGGENEEITVTLKLNIADNKEKIFIYVQDMEKSEMQSIFDLLKGLGITIFDFENEQNELVALANTIASYVKEYAVVNENTISLPSVFGLISTFVGDKNLTEETTFNALKALVTSEANQSNYDDYLTDANEILTGDSNSGKNYAQLVNEYAEKKYIIKDGESIASVLSVLDQEDMVGALTGKDGAIDLNRPALYNYFNNVAPTLKDANPTLDGHTLAYIIDTYKGDIGSMLGLDESSANLLSSIKVADVVVDSGVMSVRIVLNVEDILSLIEGAQIGSQFLNVLEDGKQILSITLSIALEGKDTTKVTINEMSEQEFESINELLKVFGLTYFDFEDNSNPLSSIVKKLKNIINKYMPYNKDKQVFEMYSLFDIIAKYIDFDGKTLTSDQTYTLVRSIATYDDSAIVEEDYSSIDYEKNLNDLTSKYYAIDNGAELLQKVTGGSLSIDDITINASTIKNGSGDYKKSFVYSEENLLPFINSFGIDLGNEGFILNRIDVIENDVVSMNLIVSLSALGLDAFDFVSDILPEKFSVTVPISFGSAQHGDWQIDNMENFEKIKEIFSIIGFNLDKTIDDARNSFAGENSISSTFNDYGIKFIVGQEDGLLLPAFTALYTLIDNTLSENDIIILIDNVVCYSQSNIVKGEDYEKEYQGAFNNLAKEYYAINNGFSLIDTALNSQVDLSSLAIDKAQLNTGKYKQSFVYEDKYLLNFINGLGMGVNSETFALNRVRVSNDNELSTNVIVNVSALMGNGNLGAFGSLLPEQLSVNIPISFGSSSQNAWSIDGIASADLESIKTTLTKFEVDIDSQVNEQRENIISSVGSSFDEYGMKFVGATENESAGLLMPSLTKLYTTLDDTLSENDIVVLIDNVVLYDESNIVKGEDYEKEYQTAFNNLAKEYYAINNGFTLIDNALNSQVDLSGLAIDKAQLNTGKYKQSFVYEDKYLLNFINGLGMGVNSETFALNRVRVSNDNELTANVIVKVNSLLEGSNLGAFGSLLPEKLSVNIPISFESGEQSKWSIDGIDSNSLADVSLALTKFEVDIDSQVNEQRENIISSVGSSFGEYGMKFVGATQQTSAGLLMPSLTKLYTTLDDTLTDKEFEVLIEDVVLNATDVQIVENSGNAYKTNFNKLASKYYAIKDDEQVDNDGGFAVIKNAMDGNLDASNLNIDKQLLITNKKHNDFFMYDESNLVPFINGLGMGVDDDKLKLNTVVVKQKDRIQANVIVTLETTIGDADLGSFKTLLPTYLSVNIPIYFDSIEQDSWYIDGVNDAETLVSALAKYGVDVADLIEEQRNNLIDSVKGSFNDYGIAFDKTEFEENEVAGLKLPSLLDLYTKADNTFEKEEVKTLIEELVFYDEETYAKEESDKTNAYKDELNTLTHDHYAIKDGYDTIAHLVNSDGFSIDELDFDVNIFRNGERDYVNAFIYQDKYLASFIKNVGLISQNDGFILNRITVKAKDLIEVNLLVDVMGVSGDADYGAMSNLIPTMLSVSVPISFDSGIEHGQWFIVGMNDTQQVVNILSEKLGVKLNDLVEDKRSEFTSDLGQTLKDKDMSFDIKDGQKGLLLPSVCTLYASEKGDDFTEDEAIYLFDNLVCYKAIYHTMFPTAESKEQAKQEFVNIMREHYLVKDHYTGEAQYKAKDSDWVVRDADNVEVDFEMLLMSLGFTLQDYEGYYVPTEELMDIPDNLMGLLGLMGDTERLNNLRNDVLIKNEILTLWVETVGLSDRFELEQIVVTANDHIRFTGFINKSEFMGEGDDVCQTATSLMADKLNVTMEINLKPQSGEKTLVNYYIEDLVGSYGNNAESDREKSEKLLSIIQKLDPDLHIDDEMFDSCAEEVATTINDMLDNISGIDPFNANDSDPNNDNKEQARAVFYQESEVPAEFEKFNTNSGFYLPDGASFAYKNSEEFKDLFDTYYNNYLNPSFPF